MFISTTQAVMTNFLSILHQKWCWKLKEKKGVAWYVIMNLYDPVFIHVFNF